MHIIEATVKNDLTLLKQLLINGENPNYIEDDAEVSALHHAVSNNFYDAALLLITAGAIIKKEKITQATPLEIARICQHSQLINLLKRLIINYSKFLI